MDVLLFTFLLLLICFFSFWLNSFLDIFWDFLTLLMFYFLFFDLFLLLNLFFLKLFLMCLKLFVLILFYFLKKNFCWWISTSSPWKRCEGDWRRWFSVLQQHDQSKQQDRERTNLDRIGHQRDWNSAFGYRHWRSVARWAYHCSSRSTHSHVNPTSEMSQMESKSSRRHARMSNIVSRLASTEKLAGMEKLCSDKTGTPIQSIMTIESRLPWCETLEQGLMLSRSTEWCSARLIILVMCCTHALTEMCMSFSSVLV